MSELKLTKRAAFSAVLIVTLTIAVYSVLTNGYRALLAVDQRVLALALAVYFASWLVTAIRLKLLHGALDGSERTLTLRSYFCARLLGGLVALLTPSAIGGEPARAYYIYERTGSGYTRYLALAVYEVYYDIVVVNVLAIALSFYKMPYTVPVVLVGSASLTFWLAVYILMKSSALQRKIQLVVAKVAKLFGRASGMSFTSEWYASFAGSFKEIADKMSFRDKAIATLLTVAACILNALVIVVIAVPTHFEKRLTVILFESLAAYTYALTLGALPLPGGAVAIEYGLSLALEPGVVVVSRAITYYSVIASGLPLLLRTWWSARPREK